MDSCVFDYGPNRTETAKARLEYLREQHRAGTMSWGEIAELQSLAEHIEPGDVELEEAAGIPEGLNHNDFVMLAELDEPVIEPGDTVEITGDSTFGFNDRKGEIAVVHGPCAAVPGSLAVVAKPGTYTDLFPLSSLKLVAKATS